MDHFVGLNFSANFNFALVGHLLKGKVASDTVISCPQSRAADSVEFKSTVISIMYATMCKFQQVSQKTSDQNMSC